MMGAQGISLPPEVIQWIISSVPGLGPAFIEHGLKGAAKQVRDVGIVSNLPFHLLMQQSKQLLGGGGQGFPGLGGNVAGGATPMQAGMGNQGGRLPVATSQFNPGGLQTPGTVGGG